LRRFCFLYPVSQALLIQSTGDNKLCNPVYQSHPLKLMKTALDTAADTEGDSVVDLIPVPIILRVLLARHTATLTAGPGKVEELLDLLICLIAETEGVEDKG